MKDKFDETYKNIMHLISEDAGFDFLGYAEKDPKGMIKVKKSMKAGVYACIESDENLDGAKALETTYSKDELEKTNFICTAKVGESAGKFWVATYTQFDKRYDINGADKENTITETYKGKERTFVWYPPKGVVDECFRLPTDMKETTWQGNLFQPGSYVFIKNGECDKYQRTAEFMQSQYEYVGKGDEPANDSDIYKQYNEIIDGKDS